MKISSKPPTANDVQRLIAWAKENSAILKRCPLHNFKADDPKSALTQYRCTACGGVVTSDTARGYILGLEHGKIK